MITDRDIKKLKKVFLTKNEAKKFATKEDLKRFATKDDLKNYPTKIDMKNEFQKYTDMIMKEMTGFIGEVYEKLSAKIDLILADNKDARNTLDTHERRIERLEEQVYTTTSS